MTESFGGSEGQPAWQDIDLEEIRALLAEERIARAVMLAKVRRDGVRDVMEDITHAIAENAGEISVGAWQREYEDYEIELAELNRVINQHSN